VIRLLVDQNVNERILKGLVRREPAIDMLRVRAIGLSAADDPVILERAAWEDRVLLTHDRRTLPGFAYARVVAHQPIPGVVVVSKKLSIGQAIDELLLAVYCLSPDECKDAIRYFPL
jgi:predicted nuclease of predicted toxin-antitoxin system